MKPVQLPPGHVSALILLAGVAWTAGGRALAKTPCHWEQGGSLYADLSTDRRTKAIADLILAIHTRDKATIRRLKCWCSTAMAFIADSVARQSWVGREAEFKREWAKLKPLNKLVASYLPKGES